MSGEPLRGPSMTFFLEEGVVKIFFFGGGGGKGRGRGYMLLGFLDLEWSSEQAVRATLPLCMLQIKITFR